MFFPFYFLIAVNKALGYINDAIIEKTKHIKQDKREDFYKKEKNVVLDKSPTFFVNLKIFD